MQKQPKFFFLGNQTEQDLISKNTNALAVWLLCLYFNFFEINWKVNEAFKILGVVVSCSARPKWCPKKKKNRGYQTELGLVSGKITDYISFSVNVGYI